MSRLFSYWYCRSCGTNGAARHVCDVCGLKLDNGADLTCPACTAWFLAAEKIGHVQVRPEPRSPVLGHPDEEHSGAWPEIAPTRPVELVRPLADPVLLAGIAARYDAINQSPRVHAYIQTNTYESDSLIEELRRELEGLCV